MLKGLHVCVQIDKCFGFDTAVEEAQTALLAAKVEAISADQGIGLVKLMGRSSGFIAMQASMASGNLPHLLPSSSSSSAAAAAPYAASVVADSLPHLCHLSVCLSSTSCQGIARCKLVIQSQYCQVVKQPVYSWNK